MTVTVVSKLGVGLLVAALVLIGAWDVYLAISKIDGETPSDIILGFLQRYPVIAAAVGVLLGHLLWPQYR